MKITKLGHACLLVEMPAPVNRTVLFDPGELSEVSVDSLEYLDDILITHEHYDHVDVDLVKDLRDKFPMVRVTAPAPVLDKLEQAGVTDVRTDTPEGVRLFDAPHEGHPPFLTPPAQNGYHYLDKLSHPGDSHSFKETCPVLALPVTAPWGSVDRAVQLALELRPQYIIPIHDWHWRDEVRVSTYDRLEKLFQEQGIRFIKAENGVPFVLDV